MKQLFLTDIYQYWLLLPLEFQRLWVAILGILLTATNQTNNFNRFISINQPCLSFNVYLFFPWSSEQWLQTKIMSIRNERHKIYFPELNLCRYGHTCHGVAHQKASNTVCADMHKVASTVPGCRGASSLVKPAGVSGKRHSVESLYNTCLYFYCVVLGH